MSALDLSRRVAVVTGARRGIGAAIARSLLDHGASVVICGRSDDEMAEARARLSPFGDVAWFAGDLHQSGERARLTNWVGPIDILVNNAGGFLRAATALDCDSREWNDQLAANLTLPFLMSQAVLPSMIERGWGRIINIGSIVATAPQLGNSIAYVAAKSGLVGLSKQMAAELGGTGVTVNVVNPGTVLTEHLQDYLDSSPDVTAQDLARRIPAGRLGRPEEIASVIPFLTSDDSEFITGAVIDINGAAVHA